MHYAEQHLLRFIARFSSVFGHYKMTLHSLYTEINYLIIIAHFFYPRQYSWTIWTQFQGFSFKIDHFWSHRVSILYSILKLLFMCKKFLNFWQFFHIPISIYHIFLSIFDPIFSPIALFEHFTTWPDVHMGFEMPPYAIVLRCCHHLAFRTLFLHPHIFLPLWCIAKKS